MTLLVLSDSHGRVNKIEAALALNKNADAILFLGDGLRDISRAELEGKSVISVSGNCDAFTFSAAPDEHMARFGEYNVLLTHGHAFYVKQTLSRAIAYAAQRDADLLLYGHTHTRHDEYFPEGTEIGGVTLRKPLHVFNPGSIGNPRDGRYSFGIITIRGKDILTSHGEV